MPYPYTMLVTAVTGNVLAASDYNNEHQNHINNNDPTAINDSSANVAAMQAVTDPGEVGTESLSTTLDGEIQRLRNIIKETHGGVQWYTTPTSNVSTLTTYVASLSAYRRPNLKWVSATVVGTETGLNGTSGASTILFPDGTMRTDSDTTRIQMTISQNAVFNNATRASNLGGLRTGTVAANTWYALYAVKVTAGSGISTDFVVVADTVLPLQANYATLNTNFGTSGWVYLGMIRYGDNASSGSTILSFVQNGNKTFFTNKLADADMADGNGCTGIRLANTASATTLTWSVANGTGAAQVPDQLTLTSWVGSRATPSATKQFNINDSAGSIVYYIQTAFNDIVHENVCDIATAKGLQVISVTTAVKLCIVLTGFRDAVLGAGSNPVL